MKGLQEAMLALGWWYDAATDGYRKGRGAGGQWVARTQVEAAYAGAEKGEAVEPEQGLSETFAGIIVGAGLAEANDA